MSFLADQIEIERPAIDRSSVSYWLRRMQEWTDRTRGQANYTDEEGDEICMIDKMIIATPSANLKEVMIKLCLAAEIAANQTDAKLAGLDYGDLGDMYFDYAFILSTWLDMRRLMPFGVFLPDGRSPE